MISNDTSSLDFILIFDILITLFFLIISYAAAGATANQPKIKNKNSKGKPYNILFGALILYIDQRINHFDQKKKKEKRYRENGI